MMYITVKAYRVGFHCWPEAPEEVGFLRDLHRHVFHIEAEMEVFHNERELEFFLIQAELNSILEEIFAQNNHRISCENIAAAVQTKLKSAHPGVSGRRVNVRVSEDGENGVWLVDP